MSLLHSFYCWGSVGVILLSTLFFAVFGIDHWKWLACVWALVPLYNIYNFATCPIERLTEEGKGMKIRELFRLPVFWLAILLMVCAGASELAMAQWAWPSGLPLSRKRRSASPRPSGISWGPACLPWPWESAG